MIVLGIGLQHDSGAALVADGKILAAVNEERLNRKKIYWGWPVLAIPEVLRIAGVDPSDVDVVAIANTTHSTYTPNCDGFYPTDLKRRALIHASRMGLAHLIGGTQIGISAYRTLNAKTLRRSEPNRFRQFLRDLMIEAPVRYVDHHRAHLASAYYTSGFESCLNISLDGVGDGYCSRIAVCRDGRMQPIHRIPFYHTPGQYYGFVTAWAGFKPGRHEGKITGLAAYGDPDKAIGVFEKRIDYDPKRFSFVNRGRWGWAEFDPLCRELDNYSKADVAAAVQQHLENLVARYIRQAVEQTGMRRVALSGGIFANVKLNQRILEIDGVDDIFVHPNMGDGGLGLGSALDIASENGGLIPARIENAYLGAAFSDDEIEKELNAAGLPFARHENAEAEIGRLLADGRVIARVNGQMEYGPRALGNRSILYQATDPSVNHWLNQRLKRTEFMPFAPAVLAERAGDYFKDYRSTDIAAEFMTVTYDVTSRCAEEAPAVVHVDGTARPQVVTARSNPSFHRILKAYEHETGFGQVVNTSFNMHEEPIVCSPADAVRAFRMGHLDVLAIGSFVAENPVTTLRERTESVGGVVA